MSVARHPRPKELVGVPIEDIMQKYVGRFKEKKPDWAALPCPGSTYMIDSVKLLAGITLVSPCLPEPPAPMNRCWARLKPSILASSKAAQSARFSL